MLGIRNITRRQAFVCVYTLDGGAGGGRVVKTTLRERPSLQKWQLVKVFQK